MKVDFQNEIKNILKVANITRFVLNYNDELGTNKWVIQFSDINNKNSDLTFTNHINLINSDKLIYNRKEFTYNKKTINEKVLEQLYIIIEKNYLNSVISLDKPVGLQQKIIFKK